MSYDLNEAIEVIKQGGIVIFPTDTAFGIGCRVDDERAVKRLFEIRKRPESQATPVLFDSIERVRKYTLSFDPKVEKLMNDYWPGALTVVLKCKVDKIPKLVRGGGLTIGARIPDHEKVLELIKGADIPILGPSANFHGRETPYEYGVLDKKLIKLVDFVLEGETKSKGNVSTVIDCSKPLWKIIRQGKIALDL